MEHVSPKKSFATHRGLSVSTACSAKTLPQKCVCGLDIVVWVHYTTLLLVTSRVLNTSQCTKQLLSDHNFPNFIYLFFAENSSAKLDSLETH